MRATSGEEWGKEICRDGGRYARGFGLGIGIVDGLGSDLMRECVRWRIRCGRPKEWLDGIRVRCVAMQYNIFLLSPPPLRFAACGVRRVAS